MNLITIKKTFFFFLILQQTIIFSQIYNSPQNINSFHTIIFNGDETTFKPGNDTHNKLQTNVTDQGVNLTVTADFLMQFLLLLDENDNEFLDYSSNTEFNVSVRKGKYILMTVYYDEQIPEENTFFYKEFTVNKDTSIILYLDEANKVKEFKLLRIDGSNLVINQISFLFSNKNNYGIRLENVELNSTFFVLLYNSLPTINFSREWRIKGKQLFNNGDLYLLNGELNAIDDYEVIINDPSDYAHAYFNYNFPENADIISPQIGFFPGGHFFFDDPEYTIPIRISIYQDISSREELKWSKFYQIVSLSGQRRDNDLVTVQTRLDHKNVKGYLSNNYQNIKFLLSNKNEVNFGMTPLYWFGKFNNNLRKIEISNTWGAHNATQLFLTQTNDVIPHETLLKIKNYRDSLILTKKIEINKVRLELGYVKDSVQFSVLPDKYTVLVISDTSEVAHKPAKTIAEAKFDLTTEDKNPPYMTLFQILSNNQVTNTLNNNAENIVRFKMEDDDSLNEVKMFYSPENTDEWNPLQLFKKHGYYFASLPNLSIGYYALQIEGKDLTGNSIKVTMTPAFKYDLTTGINDNRNNLSEGFRLYQNYPNPFNPSTTIKYSLPQIPSREGKERSDRGVLVTLKVYDVLGREVATLVNERQAPGNYEVIFNANTAEGELPSGIYFVKLTSGNFSQVIKVVLLK